MNTPSAEPPNPHPVNVPSANPALVQLKPVFAPLASSVHLKGSYTYVLSAAHTVWVVDPGPEDRSHAQAVVDAVVESGARRVGGIILTHHHADHSGALAMVRRALNAATGIKVPIYSAAVKLIPAAQAPPAELLANGQKVADIVYLPGHTADSLGLLVEGGRMITGDALLGRSSGALGADGNLHDYLQSLRVLQSMNLDGRISALYPGHGEIIEGPSEVAAEIENQINHRLRRIEQVKAARKLGKLTIDALLQELYEPQFQTMLAQGENAGQVEKLRQAAIRNLKLTLEYLKER